MLRVLGVLFALGCVACSISSEQAPVMLRLVNTGLVSFDSVIVQFPEQREVFGSLAVQDTSGYRSVSTAYRYAPISAWDGNIEYRLQPIDYVGEQPLTGGRYRYELLSQTDATWLGLELVRE